MEDIKWMLLNKETKKSRVAMHKEILQGYNNI